MTNGWTAALRNAALMIDTNQVFSWPGWPAVARVWDLGRRGRPAPHWLPPFGEAVRGGTRIRCRTSAPLRAGQAGSKMISPYHPHVYQHESCVRITLWFVEHTSGCVGAQSVVLYTGLVGREARSGDHVARLLFARARRSASLSA